MLKMKITKKEASYVQKIMQDRNNGDYCFVRSHFWRFLPANSLLGTI